MYIKTDLTNQQKSTLQDIFYSVGDWTQPHVAAQRLGLKRQEAIALLDSLVKRYPKNFVRKYLICHICSEAPVSSLPDNETIRQGWICPQCEEEVELDGITLDFAYEAIAPANFTNPEDGLVRYWQVDYFPYYVRGFSPNTEPVMVLESKDAEKFDLILEGQTISRQKAFAKVEEQYKSSVYAIAKDITVL